MRSTTLVLVSILLASCAKQQLPAPVVALNTGAKVIKTVRNEGVERYIVAEGDTLASIAQHYRTPTHMLASLNGLRESAHVYPGQVLLLHAKPDIAYAADDEADYAPPEQPPVKVAQKTTPTIYEKSPAAAPTHKDVPLQVANGANWKWPTRGPILQKFPLEGNRKKGIEIGGEMGQAIVAAKEGTVVYTGAGIRGYGQMVIVKHADNYLSAYGHTDQILVKEGDTVAAGDKIAIMGQDENKAKLHFEVRRFGKPVDPMRFLPQT